MNKMNLLKQKFENKGFIIKKLNNSNLIKEIQNLILDSNHKLIKGNLEFNKKSINLQNKIYKKKIHLDIVRSEQEIFKKILKIKNLSELKITSFLHLRAVKQRTKKNNNFLGFHRETFYSDFDYTRYQINISIPILNYTNKNSMKIIEKSHNIPDEKISTLKLTSLESGIKKNSYEHRLGLAYNPKLITDGVDLKKAKRANLETGQFMVFSSNLIHGNGINHERETRYSIDFGLIKKKYLVGKKIKNHKISHSKDKKYWIDLI